MATNENGDTPAVDEGELQSIDDPDELSQKKRVKEILNRRSGVIDARNAAKEAWISGEISKQEAITIYQTEIESLILDLWTKFTKTDDNDGEKYLESEEIDSVVVSPPADELPSDTTDFASGEDYPDAKEEVIEGLRWFIEHDPVIRKPFRVSTWNPPTEKTVVGAAILDFETLDKAVQTCMKFIDESGIDADLEDDTEDAEFDYSDLLDEDGDDPE